MATYSFATSVLKVLKQVHPRLTYTKKGMAVTESMLGDCARVLAAQAHSQAVQRGQTALNVVSVLAAVHTVVPGALATHAESEGSKACYIFCRPPTFEDPNAVPMASEDACELDTDLELPRSQRFRLAFPTGKVALILRDSPSASGLPINLSAVVCLSSVLEYLCAEILELSGNAIRNSQQGEQTTRINPNHVRMAIQGDAELTALLVTACSPDPTFNEVPESFKGPAVYDNRERTWNFDISSDDEAAPELADD